MILEERPQVRILFLHQRIVLPRLGNHHQDRVRQRPAINDQELQRIVKRRRVRTRFSQDREHLLQLIPENLRLQRPRPRPHPIAVAAQRVDLAVVSDVPKRVRQRPRREGVGRKPAVYHRQRAFKLRILQILVIVAKLRRSQHPLVDDPVGRQRIDVKHFPSLLRKIPELDHVLRPLPHQVKAAVKVAALVKRLTHGHEDLPDDRLDHLGRRPDKVVIDRHIAPPQHHHRVLADDLLHRPFAHQPRRAILRQEHHPDRIIPRLRQSDPELLRFLAEELIRHLHEYACTVAAVLFTPAGAAVVHVLEHQQRVGDELVRRDPLHLTDKPNAARVMFVSWVVQSLGRGIKVHRSSVRGLERP